MLPTADVVTPFLEFEWDIKTIVFYATDGGTEGGQEGLLKAHFWNKVPMTLFDGIVP